MPVCFFLITDCIRLEQLVLDAVLKQVVDEEMGVPALGDCEVLAFFLIELGFLINNFSWVFFFLQLAFFEPVQIDIFLQGVLIIEFGQQDYEFICCHFFVGEAKDIY